jgi:hypothetical protein
MVQVVLVVEEQGHLAQAQQILVVAVEDLVDQVALDS